MDFTKFVTESVELLAAALFILGVLLKNTKALKDAYIPFILLGIGLALRIWANGLVVESVFEGIFAVGAAVLTSQLIKQGKELGDE